MKREHRIQVSYKEIIYKGTGTLLITFGAGILFGKDNMMIAFVLALGSSTLALQNLRIKTLYKVTRLILIDLIIVMIAYIASLNKWIGIPINLITLFTIVYLNVSLYNQTSYKTWMMLYVFCQYASIPFSELPIRMLMVIYAVSIVVIMIYIEQAKIKALLPPQVGRAFELIRRQLHEMTEGKFNKEVSGKVSNEMNELAYIIYSSSFKRYFTTYVGRVYFHFYLNVNYFNFLLEQIYEQQKKGFFKREEIREIEYLFVNVQGYFERSIERERLIECFDEYVSCHQSEVGFREEVAHAIKTLRKNFKEMSQISNHKKNQVYTDWKRSNLRKVKQRLGAYFKPRNMSLNFAMRMALILTIALLLAAIFGFYKFIWAIIPIMSITQPYLEDTNKRGIDRFESNMIAAVVITIILNMVHIRWVTIAILVAAFYLYYAYKDYYHASLFLTIISMCISTVSMPINTLLFYRIVYVVIGVTVVKLTSYIKPYRLKDGVLELVNEIEKLNMILEEESILNIEGKGDLNRIREAVIYSAVLCQKLYTKNKQCQDKKIDNLIVTNTEFVVRLGYHILSPKF